MSNLTWAIGDVRITAILDTETHLPIRGLFPQVDAEAIAPHIDWLMPHFLDEDGCCTLAMHVLLIESSGRKIVVDTGWGQYSLPGHEMFVGSKSTLDDLACAGFPRESIDVVVCTHLHIDHVGRNTMQSGHDQVPTFPNARYIFARREWEYWNGATDRSWVGNFDEAVTPVIRSGLADLVDAPYRITHEVWIESTPGHTPGHVSVNIASGGKRAIILGDVAHHPVQWAEPDWSIAGDSDPALAAQTRHRLLREYTDSGVLLIGAHFPSPMAGYLASADGKARLEVASP